MKIEKATSKDNLILTEITKKSKAFWNYSEEQMELWSELLTISKDYIEANLVFKLIVDYKIIGYYSCFKQNPNIIKLDNLFLLPKYIGKGYGNLLMHDFLNRIKESQQIHKIILYADPNAEKFYLKFGFMKVGELETSIKNRFLPVMELNL